MSGGSKPNPPKGVPACLSGAAAALQLVLHRRACIVYVLQLSLGLESSPVQYHPIADQNRLYRSSWLAETPTTVD